MIRLCTLLLAAPLAAAAGEAPTLADVTARLEALLLEGKTVDASFLATLAPLPPADRLLALAYARRAGIYEGPGVPLSQLTGDSAP